MQTAQYLLAQHLPILHIILPASCTLILAYNHFSLYSFITMQNFFYVSSTFLYFLVHTSLTYSHHLSATLYFLPCILCFHLIKGYSKPLFFANPPWFSVFYIWKIFTNISFNIFTLTPMRTTMLGNQTPLISLKSIVF